MVHTCQVDFSYWLRLPVVQICSVDFGYWLRFVVVHICSVDFSYWLLGVPHCLKPVACSLKLEACSLKPAAIKRCACRWEWVCLG
jgi:hypothetical protein